MHPRVTEFATLVAEQFNMEIDIHEFPEGTKTAQDAAEAIGCDVAQIASSIVFMVDDEPVIVVTSGANRVSEKRLEELFDADTVRMAKADEVKATTGWSIGGVPPYCHDQDLTVVFDETLTEFDTVWAAAGTPQAVFPTEPSSLVEKADATIAQIAE